MLEADRQRKLKLVRAAHVKPLVDLIRGWERPDRTFPLIDPEDGGVGAKVLFLQHTPGPTAVRSGFISRENRDKTAPRADQYLREAGFARSDYIRWNVVPYCISTPEIDGKATSSQVREAADLYTKPFLKLLPNLKVIVFCGGKAREQIRWLAPLPRVEVIETYHCGARSPREWEVTRQDFKRAYELMAARS